MSSDGKTDDLYKKNVVGYNESSSVSVSDKGSKVGDRERMDSSAANGKTRANRRKRAASDQLKMEPGRYIDHSNTVNFSGSSLN